MTSCPLLAPPLPFHVLLSPCVPMAAQSGGCMVDRQSPAATRGCLSGGGGWSNLATVQLLPAQGAVGLQLCGSGSQLCTAWLSRVYVMSGGAPSWVSQVRCVARLGSRQHTRVWRQLRVVGAGQSPRRCLQCWHCYSGDGLPACACLPASCIPLLWRCAGCAGCIHTALTREQDVHGLQPASLAHPCWSGSTQHQTSLAQGEAAVSTCATLAVLVSAQWHTPWGQLWVRTKDGCKRSRGAAGCAKQHACTWHSGCLQGPKAGALPESLDVCDLGVVECVCWLILQGAGPAARDGSRMCGAGACGGSRAAVSTLSATRGPWTTVVGVVALASMGSPTGG